MGREDGWLALNHGVGIKSARNLWACFASISGVFIPSRAREQMLLDVQNGARIAIHRPETACRLLTTRGPSDCGSSKIEEGLQAHCKTSPRFTVKKPALGSRSKNQPSVHGQLAGISKLNPRRLGTRFYKSEVRSDLVSAERAGSAGKHCSCAVRAPQRFRVKGLTSAWLSSF
jgi:hypothetical protein